MSKKFKKQEYHRYVRVGKTNSWRKPRGHHSKMREHRKGNPPVVDAGFGTCARTRFLHPTGLREVLVSRISELAGLDKTEVGVRVSAKLSILRKVDITKEAQKLGLTVFNPAKPRKKKAEEKKPDKKAKAEAKAEPAKELEKKPEVKKE